MVDQLDITGPIAVVTLHTECDKDEHWNIRYPLSFRSVEEAIPNVLEKVFQEFGVKPTYLISAEVFENDISVDVLSAQSARGELGTHFHGEFLEPQRPIHPKTTADYGCQYEEEIERAKLAWLTFKFKETFGYQPRSFSAGRWGASVRTARLLAESGYIVDSSIVSFMRRDHLGFSEKILLDTGMAYFPSLDDLATPGDLSLVEIPVTAFPTSQLQKNPLGISKLTRLFCEKRKSAEKLTWLRPTFSSVEDMRHVVDASLTRHGANTVVNVMFHPFELIPGLSPYATTVQASRRILDRLQRLLDHIVIRGFNFRTLGGAAKTIIQKKEAHFQNDIRGVY